MRFDTRTMSSRALQKAELRARREEAERLEREQAHRRRLLRLWALAGVLAVAVGVLAAIGLSGGGGPGGGDAIAGAADSGAMLQGVPQQGTTLGDPEAKVVLTEFADLQCPYCKEYALNVLPQIVDRYVRPGKLRLDMRLLRFIGPDSVRGAQAAMAAAEQDRMWNFVDLWYRNQGTENTGYADDGFISGVGRAASVVNPLAAVEANTFEKQLVQAEAAAQEQGIDSTPSFVLDGRRLALESLTVEALSAEIDAALAK